MFGKILSPREGHSDHSGSSPPPLGSGPLLHTAGGVDKHALTESQALLLATGYLGE